MIDDWVRDKTAAAIDRTVYDIVHSTAWNAMDRMLLRDTKRSTISIIDRIFWRSADGAHRETFSNIIFNLNDYD